MGKNGARDVRAEWMYRARIGPLVPDGDVGPEAEFSALIPRGVCVNASRLHFASRQDAEAPGQIGMTSIEAVRTCGRPFIHPFETFVSCEPIPIVCRQKHNPL